MEITYNEDLNSIRRKQKDAQAIQDFAHSDKTLETMTLTYDDAKECRRRRLVLKALIDQNPKWKLYLTQRREKLFVIKER